MGITDSNVIKLVISLLIRSKVLQIIVFREKLIREATSRISYCKAWTCLNMS